MGRGTESYKEPFTLSNKSTSDSSGLKVNHEKKGQVRWQVMLMMPEDAVYNRVKITLYM